MDGKEKGLAIGAAVLASIGIGVAYYKATQKTPTVPPPTCPSPCGTYDTYIRNSDGTQMGATAVSGSISGLKATGVSTTFMDVANCASKTVGISTLTGNLSSQWYVSYNGVIYAISSELCNASPSPSPTGCPNSCSADSDCSGCGADFVCEGGQCIKQIPVAIDAPLSADIQSETQYVTNCTAILVEETCNKCNGQYAPYMGSALINVYVRDKSGRPIPNVPVSIASSVVNPKLSFTWQTYNNTTKQTKQYTSGQTATTTTDDLGRIQIPLWGNTMPIGWGDIQDSNYPCTGCQAEGTQGSAGPLSFGQLTYTVLGSQSIAPAITLITNTVSYKSRYQRC